MRKICLLLVSVFLVSSCETLRDAGEARRVQPLLVSNGPVNFGQSLEVRVSNVSEDYYYELITPDGRTAYDETSYETDEARQSDEGWYKILAWLDGELEQDSILVDVIPAPIPCTPITDALRSNTNISLDFYGVGGRTSFDDFEVNANAVGGDLTLIFGGEGLPVEGTYICKSQSGFNQSDEVSVRLNTGILLNGVPEQLIHVSVENGKTVITACDFEMSYQGSDITVEFRIEFD